MSDDLIQFAFTAGEQSPKLEMRGDFEKYGFGLSQAHNWYVDFHGGLNTRPGFEGQEIIQDIELGVKLIKFQFSNELSNSYVIILTDDRIRFTQSGAYVLEASKTIASISQSAPYTVTTDAVHGYTTDDMVKISLAGDLSNGNDRAFYVDVTSTTTFTLRDTVTNETVLAGDESLLGTGIVGRVYTLANPYDVADLASLRSYGIRDTIRLTHGSYPIMNLTRSGHASWALSEETVASDAARPGTLTIIKSSTGDAGTMFTVTAVYTDGTESVPSDIAFVTSMVDHASTLGSVTLNWVPLAGVAYYNVYRSLIYSDDADLSAASDFGFIGRSYAAQFTDNNIIPDFTGGYPQQFNPFANEAITQIDVSTIGSGYTNSTVVSISTSTGSGFVGYPIISRGGGVVGVNILNGGKGYAATDTVNFSIGSSAVASISRSPATGNYPAISSIIQQRQIYAATENSPLSIFGSQPGLFDNFDVSTITKASDSYGFEIDSEIVAPLRHIEHMRGGMLLLSGAGIWLLNGGDSFAVSATSSFAEPQTRFGIADIPPIPIDSNLLYITDKEGTARLLSYSDFSKVYGGRDLSILSSHLFTLDNKITDWTYQETPNRLVYCVREDGDGLIFTLEIEQNIFGWTPIATCGKFKQFINVQEDRKDTVYAAISRVRGDRTVGYLERLSNYDEEKAENAICLDCATVIRPENGTGSLHFSAATGTVTITLLTGAVPFSSADVGKVLRANNGKMIITAFVSTSELTASVVDDMTMLDFEKTTPRDVLEGSWSMVAGSSTVSGLWQHEGEDVTVLADGNVTTGTVTNGSLTLPSPASMIIAGIPYKCTIKTLPMIIDGAVIQARRKDIVGMAVKVNNTRGLKYGTDLTNLYEIKERTNEAMGQAIPLRTTTDYVAVKSKFDKHGQMYIVQDQPLPARVLGLVLSTEIGDDND